MNFSDVQKAFPDVYVPEVSSYYNEKMALWQLIYENNPSWKKIKRQCLKKKTQREMSLLNTAKVLCDCFSDLTFSEQIEIKISDKKYQKYIDDVLNRNGFWKNVPDLISNAYALGGCVLKVYVENKLPRIDYVHADKFAPLEWDGNGITGGVFVTKTARAGKYYTLFERHTSGRVQYRLFRSDVLSDIGIPCDVSELYQFPDDIKYKSNRQMFSYFKPCVSNNAEYDVPLGMGIFANSIDTLKSLDVAFDSFSREFILGKKRIIIPISALQGTVDITDSASSEGRLVTYFDEDDEAFVALNAEDSEALKIVDNTVSLRIAEHVSAINALLNILCFQVGLSAGTLSFDAVQGVKTATEVISQDSKTARTMKSNKNILAETIESLIHSLVAAGVYTGDLQEKDYTVTIGFKDNVIIDDNTMIDNNVKLVQAGLKSKLSAIMEVLRCDEKTAQEELERITKEQAVTGLSVDDLMGGEEVDEG